MRALFSFLLLLPAVALADSADPTPDEIIERFAAKEAEFSRIWQQYTYTQHIVFQVIGRSGKVAEQQLMTVEVFFTGEGKREVRTLEDRGSLRSVRVTKEDIEDAVHRHPFVLTTDQLPEYKIEYKGKERVDELNTYVFEVKPRKIRRGERYFRGRIWVDDLDFQIVMTRGKVVPDYGNNKFPEFETVREQIDGRYWFPTWTKADDVLRFGSALGGYRQVHVRQLITYKNFQKFEVGTSIQYEPIESP